MKRRLVLGALVLMGGVAIAVAAQQRPQVIDIAKVSDNYYVLTSSTPGNNDRFGGNVEFVVHENTKTNMAKMDAFKGDKAQFLPKRTFRDRMTLGRGTEQIDLYYFGRGHTDGDAFVVFPSLRLVQTGDLFAWKDGPRIDRANGGSGVQYPQTIAKALAALKDIDVVVPGHSPLMKMGDLQEYQRYTADLLKTVQDAKNSGKSVDEAAAASLTMTQKYRGYASERVKVAVQDIFDELNAGGVAR